MHLRRLTPSWSLLFALLAACEGTPGEPLPLPESCEEVENLRLQPGEGIALHGHAAGLLCVDPPAEDEEYLAVVVAATPDTLPFTATPHNIVRPSGPVAAPEAPRDPIRSSDDLHDRIREIESAELTPLVGTPSDARQPARAPPSPAARIPAVGDFLELNAQAESACADPLYRTGRVEAVSDRAIVVADTENPDNGFTASDFRHFAATFDTLVAPLAEQSFGEPTDLDGNGRTIIFFTIEVNRLTAPGSTGFSAGFFFARDLFPRSEPSGRLQPCEGSNEAEIIYLLVPDPAGSIAGNAQSRSFVAWITPAVMIHEYQHLLNAAVRLHHRQLTDWQERLWLNEGLSHIAEELLFYAASGLAPGGRIDFATLQAQGPSALEAIDRHQRFNLLRLHEFLNDPVRNSPFNQASQGTLPTRGAAWSFLRYAADRRGGDPAEFFRGLVSSPNRGIDNVAGAVGGRETLDEWLADWSTANFASDRIPGVAERHRHASWNFRSVFHEGLALPADPVPIFSLRTDVPFSRELTGGGAAYLRFGVAEGMEGSVAFRSRGGIPPTSLRVTLLRTR